MIMNDKEIKDFIENNHWFFAKTYAETLPHEYCLAHLCKKDFENFVNHIHKNGKKVVFFKKEYIYFERDGYYYFTYQNYYDDIKKCKLINRAKIDDYELKNYNGTIFVYRRQNVL